jgi:N-acetylglucosaminyldiphosphoundecaprenol N-acetyl-beta-D-mannosaminyltransferase
MSKQQHFDKLDLLGISVDAVTSTEAVTYICQHAKEHREASYVVKPYVEFLDRAYQNPELQDLLNEAELSVPDGVALTWAAAYLYAGKRSGWRFWKTLFQIVLDPDALRWPIIERAAGINFTWPLLEEASRQNLRVYLVGSPKSNSIDHTAATLTKAIPDLNIVGTHSGRDDTQRSSEVSHHWLVELNEAILSLKPDLILVGMGFPLQERVCSYLAGHNPGGVFIGEGGTFDYELFGGSRSKAPEWAQRAGLEWFWRLILEPRRLSRQLAIPRFIFRIWKSR